MIKILVCVRPGRDGEISPFEKSAYEIALAQDNAEVVLLCMAQEKVKDNLLLQSRLGAKQVVLLSDPAFSGSDTLATAYAISCAIRKLEPDLVLCGRKTMEGDTGQVPPMLAEYLHIPFYSGALTIEREENQYYMTKFGKREMLQFPAVVATEKYCTLRKPKLGAQLANVSILSSVHIDADSNRIGLSGSPTRVIESRINESGKRKCAFLKVEQFMDTVHKCMKDSGSVYPSNFEAHRQSTMSGVYAFGKSVTEYAKKIDSSFSVIPDDTQIDEIELIIERESPKVILFPSTPYAKELAARLAVRKNLGLCADCTDLDTDGDRLIMIRPALSGTVLAKICSDTLPALCTVQTVSEETHKLCICAGSGASEVLDKIKALADKEGAEITASRKMVDCGYLPYKDQVGLTGKCVAPDVYLTIGLSGAIHHIVGMSHSKYVIAVNPDRNAPIFDYADYGFIITAEELCSLLRL